MTYNLSEQVNKKSLRTIGKRKCPDSDLFDNLHIPISVKDLSIRVGLGRSATRFRLKRFMKDGLVVCGTNLNPFTPDMRTVVYVRVDK